MKRPKLPFRGSLESSGHYSVSTIIYISLCFHPFQLVFFLLFQGNKASLWSYSKNTFVCKWFPDFRRELRTRARLTTVNIHIHDLRMPDAEKSSGNTLTESALITLRKQWKRICMVNFTYGAGSTRFN